MSEPSSPQRLAVCSWSLQPQSAAQLADQIESLKIPRVQIALDPLRESPEAWGQTSTVCAERNIEIVSGMFGTIGEDYSTLESIRQTGGLVPDEHWEANWLNITAAADLAKQLNLKLVAFHAGFLPHDPEDPAYTKLVDRLTRVAELFAERGIELGLETGQETADTLAKFLEELDAKNIGVNFDPANMILYAKGDPIDALRRLAPWIKQCHIKDARKTKVPGTWGEEVVVGTGEVDWPAFFQTLKDLQFTGHLCIEREAGDQRAADIHAARAFLEPLIA